LTFHIYRSNALADRERQHAKSAERIMKALFRDDTKRSELSAILMVVAVLTTGALVKIDAVTPIFHLAP